MFSLSTAKRKAAKHAAAQQQQQQRSATVNASAGRSDEDLAGSRAGVDELGRVLSGGWRGRSKSDLSRSALPLSPPPSTSKLPPLPPPPPQWLFSPTVIPPAPPATDDVAWGLIPVRTNVVLGLADVGPVVHTLAESLGRRALDTPLLFSSLALDVSVPKIKSLIGTYLATIELRPGTSQKHVDFAWAQELTFAGERELAWVLRWALARVLQVRPVVAPGQAAKGEHVPLDEKRGLVDFERYLAWRERERANGYPLIHWHAFTAMLGPDLQPIFNDLFSLFSRLAAHAHVGGCTPSVIGSLFGPLLFGLPPSSSLVDTHKAFSRAAFATEHLLLAFVRSQAHSSAQRAATLPGRLQAWVAGYPSMLASDRALADGRVRPGVKCVMAEGLRRDVRAYSPELFRTGEEWAGEMEHPEGPGRPDILRNWVERVVIPSRSGSAVSPASGPRYTADYKKRLHVPAHLPALLSTTGAVGGRGQDSGDEDDDMEGWKSLSEKKWGDFMSSGFGSLSSPSSTSIGSVEGKGRERRATISKKLEFDLTEGARKAHQEKRDTLTWTDFSSAGFSRTESTLTESLSFSNPIQKDILQWPEHREEVRRRLKKLQKDLPSFDYVTRPRHVGELVIEEAFVDCWADIFISAGWMDRSDPTLREVNWAIVNYKALPAGGTSARRPPLSPSEDPRTDDVYIFYEEIVPVEYQARLTSAKKPTGLFSAKRYKKSSAGADSVGGRSQRDKEEEFEASVLRGRPTKMLSLTSRGQQPISQAPSATFDMSPTRTPATSGPSSSLSTPQKDAIRPTRSWGELNQRSPRSEHGALSPAMHKVTSKKEARRIQGSSPFDPNELEFEMRVASSDPDGSLRRTVGKGHGRESSDLWVDILVSHGAKGASMPRHPPRAVPAHAPPLPRQPSPDQIIPVDTYASQQSTKFYEGASSEVGSLGGSIAGQSPSPLAPAIFVTATSPVSASTAGSSNVFAGKDYADSDLVSDGDAAETTARRPLPLPPAADDESTKSARLLAAVAASQQQQHDDHRDSVASDFTQPDSDVASYGDDLSPRANTPEADAIEPVTVFAPGYVHGQPLHNLLEEEEED